jgi:Ca2+-binding RTX toxin-like protein
MHLSTPIRFITYGIIILILISAVTAIAATNTVPFTRVTNRSEYISVNDLKPAACASIDLTTLVSGSGTLIGTDGNDLILGSSGADVIDGLGGDDCIVGGGGIDICTGDAGTDTFVACEVENQ